MFLDKLENEDFVKLINLCNNLDQNTEDIDERRDLIDLALVSDEADRRLMSGERYFWIRGVRRGDIPKFNGEYKLTDYWMASFDGKKDYSSVLLKFMVERFGAQYIESLYNYRLASAALESEQLLAFLSNSKDVDPDPSR